MRIAALVVLLIATPTVSLFAEEAPSIYPRPKSLGDVETYGKNIQRTMHLLASSSAEHRNTVKILFYGQSITEQNWSKRVTEDLRRRFPFANLLVENRAIGGFASQRLVKTAEADLYPFYPDLLIFHVFGSQQEYEDIIRRVRKRTTAEILMQTDHLQKGDDIDEPVSSTAITVERLSPWGGDTWAPRMNYIYLPEIAAKYRAELVNQRDLWKQYLRDYQLPPSALLRDSVHLNDRGCFLMSEIVQAYLRYDPRFDNKGSAGWVRDFVVERDLDWEDGKLTLDFDGNRVDLVCGNAGGATENDQPLEVKIDGKCPSQFSSLYACSRTTCFPGSKWPCLLRVSTPGEMQPEEWTLTLQDVASDMSDFQFNLVGSKTGFDGHGERNKPFLSRSGRIAIDPTDWNLDYAYQAYQRSVEDGFEIRWTVYPLFQDRFVPPAATEPNTERTVVLAQGLPNQRHRLELVGVPPSEITAVRVYRPPLVETR